MFSTVTELSEQTNINLKSIDILITNYSMFSPTPSLSAVVVNEFNMRSNIMSFNLSGMGCSAGIGSVGLAKDLLKVHRDCLALIVSIEMLNEYWYTGKNHSMLLSNCPFRLGGAAMLFSSRNQDNKIAKYELKHLVTTSKACDDQSYACVFLDIDMEGKSGISISKSMVNVAEKALKANMASLGLRFLPFKVHYR
ncbi:putative 3-ketoacyl-CoA synthase 21 [Camellia lanceoleosa]|uniref:3-ketoacyl-CoA synthase 21 n=1 Tax=Camellia lanceoleosa TaxID=1840588 RepID=A0ACC0HCN0_9ERIC|nr:putative 3-ketoacyl-CoA synthase 21 [Camellia lanceoleosa]